jgi:hypothetical protein
MFVVVMIGDQKSLKQVVYRELIFKSSFIKTYNLFKYIKDRIQSRTRKIIINAYHFL